MAPLNVLICGGGIAGPALAHWLAKVGHRVTIVERHPTLRAKGAQVDIRAQGIEIATRIGIMEACKKVCVPEDGIAEVDSNSKVLGTILANKSGQGAQSFTSEYEIMRGDLVQVLYDHTKDRVQYVFGKTVENFEDGEKGVKVHFSDGSSGMYDILVGADGQGSRIRKAILPKHEDPVVHLGVYMGYWMVPREEGDSAIAISYHSPGRRWILTRSHSPTETQAYFSTKDDSEQLRSIPRASLETQKEFFISRFRNNNGWQTERFLAGLKETDNFYCQEICQVQTNTWSKGRVVIMGDAAHCPSPMSGMGTTSAFVGSYVLAGEIARHSDDLTTAFANYDRTMRPFVAEMQRLPPGATTLQLPETWFGVMILRLIIQIVCFLRIPDLLARLIPAEKAGWPLPQYPELEVSSEQ